MAKARQVGVATAGILTLGAGVSFAQGAPDLPQLSPEFQWILGILTTALMAGGAWWAKSVHGQVRDLHDDTKATMKEIVEEFRKDLEAIRESVDGLRSDLAKQNEGRARFEERLIRLSDDVIRTEKKADTALNVATRAHVRMDRAGIKAGYRDPDAADQE